MSTTTSTTPVEITEDARRVEELLVREHLSLVHRTVAQTAARIPAHVSRDDLLSAGMAGLAQAARNYDEKRGVPFDRYAATRIRGSVLDELRSFDWASRPVRTKARAITALTESLTGALGRRPTEVELAEAAGVEVGDIRHLNDDVHRSVVLNYEAIAESGNSEFLLPASSDDPEQSLLLHERAQFLGLALRALPDRLRTVVMGYFFEERSVADIADQLGVTQSRVSQLRTEALELFRDGMNQQLDPANVSPLRRASGRVSRRQAAYRAAIEVQAV